MILRDSDMLNMAITRGEDVLDAKGRVVGQVGKSLNYALLLLQRGTDADLARAFSIIEQAFDAQNVVEGSYRYGNFKLRYGDETVTDINAVQFCSWYITEILKRQAEKLDDQHRRIVEDGLARALVEIDRVDVPWHYTNMTLIQTGNLIIGGELLGEEYAYYTKKGYRRFAEWVDRVNTNGAVPEHNAPGYIATDIQMLARIATHYADPQVAKMARLIEERCWIHAAVRWHASTHRLAGPYSRAYYPMVCGDMNWIGNMFHWASDDEEFASSGSYYKPGRGTAHHRAHAALFGHSTPFYEYNCPDYVLRLAEAKPLPYEVRELTDLAGGNDISTYLTEEYALGVSARTYAETPWNEASMWTTHSKSLMVHYRRDGNPDFGLLYCVYVLNDQRISEYYDDLVDDTVPGSDLVDRQLDEQGLFRGVQYRNKAIALYYPPQLKDDIFSLKTEIVVFDRSRIDEIRINGQTVPSLPAQANASDVISIADNGTFIAVLPLDYSRLGHNDPIELTEDDSGHLVISIYNYKGPRTTFWEYKDRKTYFRANMEAGFIVEIGTKREHSSLAEFSRNIAQAKVTDTTDSSYRRTIIYNSGPDEISLTLDLKSGDLLERTVNGEIYTPPYLDAPTVKQGHSGRIEVEDAILTTEEGIPAWLLVDAPSRTYVAANPTQQRVPLRLATPHGTIESPDFGFGKVVYKPGTAASMEIVGLNLYSPIYITKPKGNAMVTWNGVDVSDRLREIRHNRASVLMLPGLQKASSEI